MAARLKLEFDTPEDLEIWLRGHVLMDDIRFASGKTSRDLTVTSGAIPVVNRAVEPGQDSTLNRTWGGATASYTVSVSTGTVKAAAGVLYGIWVTTTGSFAIKDGAVNFPPVTLTAGTIWMPLNGTGVTMLTSITVSASTGVGTFFYL
jgi:hypothetical protein